MSNWLTRVESNELLYECLEKEVSYLKNCCNKCNFLIEGDGIMASCCNLFGFIRDYMHPEYADKNKFYRHKLCKKVFKEVK